MALSVTFNIDDAIEHLLKLQEDEKYTEMVEELKKCMSNEINDGAGPSTSTNTDISVDGKKKLEKIKNKMRQGMEVCVYILFQRFYWF